MVCLCKTLQLNWAALPHELFRDWSLIWSIYIGLPVLAEISSWVPKSQSNLKFSRDAANFKSFIGEFFCWENTNEDVLAKQVLCKCFIWVINLELAIHGEVLQNCFLRRQTIKPMVVYAFRQVGTFWITIRRLMFVPNTNP